MSDANEKPSRPLEVPLHVLSPEALRGIIDEFIQREGTDYGAQEASHESKVRQIQKQLEKGEVLVTFDPESETVSLLTRQQWKSLS